MDWRHCTIKIVVPGDPSALLRAPRAQPEQGQVAAGDLVSELQFAYLPERTTRLVLRVKEHGA